MQGIKKDLRIIKNNTKHINLKKKTKNNTINQQYMFRTLQEIKLI